MDVVSAIGVAKAGMSILSRLMPNNAGNPKTEFSSVLEQSMGKQFMERLDLDASGTLTLNEVKMPEAVFRQLDSNADGQLSESEINTGYESLKREEGLNHQVAEWLEMYDADFDGRVSHRESGLDVSAFVHRDMNGDNGLDSTEILKSFRSGME